MSAISNNYDLILVIGYFRSALPLLSVVRHLSSQLSIGLCFQTLNKNMDVKTGNAQKKFEQLCIEAGGILCLESDEASCKVMFVQQYEYIDKFAYSIRKRIRAKKIWGMLTLASVGIDSHDKFLQQFDISRLTVLDMGLTNFLLNERNAKLKYKNFIMIEVGLPFKKYPIFPDFNADWIIAAPTLFSFHSEAEKLRFLQDVLKFIETIPKSDVILYKPHNGHLKDYFNLKSYIIFTYFISWVPNIEMLLNYLKIKLSARYKIYILRILTAFSFIKIMKRAIPMNEYTQYAEMPIEGFLPHLRKGIIGGESNTVWGTLFFGLTYINCVNSNKRIRGVSELINKNGDPLLGLNLKYFGVPYYFDNNKQIYWHNIAYDSARHNNLVDVILESCIT
jgi:hypothetical protein